ncbi:MAG TPA: fumarylacetoacetate hydrolase family protein [Cytophagaceae bacterium]|jgi:acylpyruvate hydrolase|nr:fumarylacetoacetate hydrolase family protein [Cytophagaceae bacterium]
MKILAVGKNYLDHIKEMNSDRPEEPVIFSKPDTALLMNNSVFYLPDFSNNVQFEAELILRICKEGKNIEEKFAHKYFDGIGFGIDFTARDLQQKAKEKGNPWTLAKGFNGSAPVSEFLPLSTFPDIHNISFSLQVNGVIRQNGNSKMMLFDFGKIISYISKFITLKKGDIIFTGTPEGVDKVSMGDKLAGFIEQNKILEIEVR